MAAKATTSSWRSLTALGRQSCIRTELPQRCFIPSLHRAFATEAELPRSDEPPPTPSLNQQNAAPQFGGLYTPHVLTTIYSFPEMEPIRFEQYPSTHLDLPLRKDILHKAVVYEGDMTRQGTASTKWRTEVHGSRRKIRPQKGTGMARLGDKKSPMLRGGGVAFGPHPRDFSTELPKKMYDLAWRTALSYRYRRGELIIVEDGMELDYPKTRYVKQIFEANHWGNADGRSMVVTSVHKSNLFKALSHAGEDGRILTQKSVDVKNLLEMGRVIIEQSALNGIFESHQSDIVRRVPIAQYTS
ncbi:MAG: hypothetical protein M4579_001408 [Chaenotheca gracillima]|nr:MAG: hypothetical protein M4579_001408 [Chaenotheca gracillima]